MTQNMLSSWWPGSSSASPEARVIIMLSPDEQINTFSKGVHFLSHFSLVFFYTSIDQDGQVYVVLTS